MNTPKYITRYWNLGCHSGRVFDNEAGTFLEIPWILMPWTLVSLGHQQLWMPSLDTMILVFAEGGFQQLASSQYRVMIVNEQVKCWDHHLAPNSKSDKIKTHLWEAVVSNIPGALDYHVTYHAGKPFTNFLLAVIIAWRWYINPDSARYLLHKTKTNNRMVIENYSHWVHFLIWFVRLFTLNSLIPHILKWIWKREKTHVFLDLASFYIHQYTRNQVNTYFISI